MKMIWAHDVQEGDIVRWVTSNHRVVKKYTHGSEVYLTLELNAGGLKERKYDWYEGVYLVRRPFPGGLRKERQFLSELHQKVRLVDGLLVRVEHDWPPDRTYTQEEFEEKVTALRDGLDDLLIYMLIDSSGGR